MTTFLWEIFSKGQMCPDKKAEIWHGIGHGFSISLIAGKVCDSAGCSCTEEAEISWYDRQTARNFS